MPEGRILTGNVFPKTPYAAGADFCIAVGGMVLVAVDGSLGTASVCDEYQIIFSQQDAAFLSLYPAFDGRCDLFIAFKLKYYICDFCVKLEVYACVFQILLHRPD